MSNADLTWVASLPPLCSLIGALLISAPMQIYGRRKALIWSSIPFVFGFLIMGFTIYGRHKAQLYVGRIITGLVAGATTPASQIYVRRLKFLHYSEKPATLKHLMTDYRVLFTKHSWNFRLNDSDFVGPRHRRHIHHRRLCGASRPRMDSEWVPLRPFYRNDLIARNARLASRPWSRRRGKKGSAAITWKVKS